MGSYTSDPSPGKDGNHIEGNGTASQNDDRGGTLADEQLASNALPPEAIEWQSRSKELAGFFWPLVNRTDVWGGYHPFKDRGKKYTDSTGKECELGKTTTRPSKKARGRVLLTPQLLQRHFATSEPQCIVGLHTTSERNTCRWGALEIDVHGEDGPAPEVTLAAGIAWHDQLRDSRLTPLLTGSNGCGGCHLRFLLSGEAPSGTVYAFLRDLVSDYQSLGLSAPPEIFPKQAALKPGKFGNWLRLPGLHHTRRYWSNVWDGSKWLTGHDAIDHILSLKPTSPESLVQGKDARLEKRIRGYLAKLPNRSEGQGRHAVAFGFAAWLVRDMHLPDDIALRWLGEWDAGNNPGLGADELAKQLACAHEYGQRDYGSGIGANGSHTRNRNGHADDDTKQEAAVKEAVDDPHRLARLFLADHRTEDARTLNYYREEFLAWDGTAHRRFPDKEVKARLCERIKVEFDRVAEAAHRLWDEAGGVDDQGKPIPEPVARKVTGRIIADASQALAGMTLLPSSVTTPAWIGEPLPTFPAVEMISCRNALVHLPSLAENKPCTMPPTARFFSPTALEYDYTPNAPPPKHWLNFLQELWPDDDEAIGLLQEWAGYCLLPDTRQQKILLIVGPKRSGKGTIARVLRGLVGAANTASPTLASLGTNFGLWPLLDKTLAIISDARLSHRTDIAVVTERLLAISGEDAQTIDRKNLSHVHAKLAVRFMMMTNELPRLNDPSGALVGRLLILRQTKSFYGQEDTKLTDRLLPELPSILLWAVDGWQRLQSRGRFQQPQSGLKLVQQMEDLASPIGEFLRENCIIGPGLEVPMRSLFHRWQQWCEQVGRKESGNEGTFGRDLRAAIPGIDDRQPRAPDGKRYRLYVGIGLMAKPSDDWIPD